MQAFFNEKKETEALIAEIGHGTRELENLYERASLTVSSSENDAISEELEAICSKTQRTASRAKKALTGMKAATDQLKADKAGQPAEIRIRESAHSLLLRRMLKEMREHQKLKQRFQKKTKENFHRLVKVVDPDITDDEVDRRLEAGGSSAMREIMMGGAVHADAEAALNDVQSRAKDVEMLERSVHQMFQLFQDLAALVEEQGEVLDNIEANVDSAKAFTEKGNKELIRAHIAAKKARKRRCCLMIIVVVVLAVILIPVSTLSESLPRRTLGCAASPLTRAASVMCFQLDHKGCVHLCSASLTPPPSAGAARPSNAAG